MNTSLIQEILDEQATLEALANQSPVDAVADIHAQLDQLDADRVRLVIYEAIELFFASIAY